MDIDTYVLQVMSERRSMGECMPIWKTLYQHLLFKILFGGTFFTYKSENTVKSHTRFYFILVIQYHINLHRQYYCIVTN